jgi:hypothetical protein
LHRSCGRWPIHTERHDSTHDEEANPKGQRTVDIPRGLFHMAKSPLKLIAPTEVLRTVAPTRRPNAELRTREHLTPGEVDTLIEAAKANRHGHRDATQARVAGGRDLRPALGPGRVRCRGAACAAGQERHPQPAHSTACPPERGDFATSALPWPSSTATKDVFIPPTSREGPSPDRLKVKTLPQVCELRPPTPSARAQSPVRRAPD